MPLLYALLAAAAAWVALGRINASLTADSAVPVLLGLYAWEPYFWEQNRYGMLVPLVVAPVRDPFAHLLAQTAVGAFLTLLGLHLGGRYLYRAGWSPLAGAAAVAFFLAACGPHGQFIVLCPAFAHHGGLALGFGGLLLALPRADGRVAPGRLAGAAAVLTVGAWLNLGVVPQLAPLVVFRRWLVDRAALAAEVRPGLAHSEPAR